MHSQRTGMLYFAPSALCLFLAGCGGGKGVQDPWSPPGSAVIVDQITVDATAVRADTARHPIGINTDVLLDNDAKRPAGARNLQAALTELGITYLRYPGGEEGNLYLWSVFPFDHPVSTASLPETPRSAFLTTPFDFDQFMTTCKAISCVPVIMVTHRPYLVTGMPAPTRQQLIDTAAGWVKYANTTNTYRIKYWEIGNEFYVDNSYWTGPAQPVADYVNDVTDFSTAMKAVDPSIKIGANAYIADQYLTILQKAASHIDFLVVHSYPCCASYAAYQKAARLGSLDHDIEQATQALADPSVSAADRERIKIALTETSSTDFTEKKPVGDLGHALALFEILGQTISFHPEVDFVQVWADRWLASYPNQLWDSLDHYNRLVAPGRAIGIWGEFLLNQVVDASWPATDNLVHSYASYDQHLGDLNLFLVNKDTVAHRGDITLQNYNVAGSGAGHWIFTGSGPTDTSPTWSQGTPVPVNSNNLAVELPPFSIVVVTLKGSSSRGLNVVSNPGFEIDLAGWSPLTGTPGLSPDANKGMQALLLPSGAGVYQQVNGLTPAAGCLLSGTGKVNTSGQTGRMGIRGTVAAQEWGYDISFSSTAYGTSSVQFSMPSGVQNLHVWISNASSSGAFIVDEVFLSCTP